MLDLAIQEAVNHLAEQVDAGALLTGCASKSTPPLYQWDAYQPQVHTYFTGKRSVEEQIDALEKARQQVLAKGNARPGFHTHWARCTRASAVRTMQGRN